MGGEALAATTITRHGLRGDRAYALFDPTENRVASAKLFDRFPGLLEFSAQYIQGEWPASGLPPVEVRFPHGVVVRTDAKEFLETLGAWFGKPTAISAVTDDRLVRPQAGKYAMTDTYFDYAPLHLLTDVAMASLARSSPGSLVALERFRPNLLIEGIGVPFTTVRIEATPSMTQSFMPLTTEPVAGDGSFTFRDTSHLGMRFYQAKYP